MTFEVKNGCYRYPGTERQVLQNICLQVESGKVLSILGSNGVGKTTLLRCMRRKPAERHPAAANTGTGAVAENRLCSAGKNLRVLLHGKRDGHAGQVGPLKDVRAAGRGG